MPEEEEKPKSAEKKEIRAGVAHVFGSFNNTIVHITDLAGNTIARVSGGMVTKHSRLKANPTTAMFVAKRAAERARDVGINNRNRRTGSIFYNSNISVAYISRSIISIESNSHIPIAFP